MAITYRSLTLDSIGAPLRVAREKLSDPGAGEVLVRLRAAALNHRDLWIRQGKYAGLKFPVVPGSDGSGTVEKAGAGVDAAWVGRKVILNPSLDWGENPHAQGPAWRILGLPDPGTFAEFVKVPAGQIASMPEHLSFEEAAALPLAGLTAYRALFTRGGIRSGEKLLVTGIGGGAALFLLQFGLAAGARVHVTSGSPEKLRRAYGMGAAGGIEYTRPDWAAALLEAAGPFDCIVDSAGGPSFPSLCDLARPGGRVVFFGATAGNPPELPLRKVFWRQLSLLGTTMGSPADFADMIRFVSGNRIRPVVDGVYAFDQADEALRRMEAGGQFGKLVIRVAPD